MFYVYYIKIEKFSDLFSLRQQSWKNQVEIQKLLTPVSILGPVMCCFVFGKTAGTFSQARQSIHSSVPAQQQTRK